WSQLSSVLISFGDDADKIEELKLNKIGAKHHEGAINNLNMAEAKHLKDLGNEAHKQKHFDDALKLFSQALVLAGLSDYDQSILYLNRAATHLEKRQTSEVESATDSRYLALQDAEHARDLRQTLPKAHYRVGQACVALGDFEKAVHSFDKALALDPTMFTGHQYRDSDDNVKQNYESAAKSQKDIQTAIQLLKRAGAQSPTMSDECLIPNVGVAEAEHALGLHYETGVGVEMTYHKAAKWYQRASDHGIATAANNLRFMYGDGRGVEKDLVKSEQLLHLSAVRGDQNAAMNLALLLFKRNDYQTAEQWCRCASEKNNMKAKKCLKHFQDAAECERDQFKKLDVETWEKQNSLFINNLNYNERIQRKKSAEDPDAA
ncbi:unnamed protein product, partial [Didymodactylos carnosus]